MKVTTIANWSFIIFIVYYGPKPWGTRNFDGQLVLPIHKVFRDFTDSPCEARSNIEEPGHGVGRRSRCRTMNSTVVY